MSQFSILIDEFVCSIKDGTIDIYNEYSLQHELGIFLRHKLTNYKVQFERNVNFFFDRPSTFTKREIDIAIFPRETLHPCHAIELKFPRNGQYPEQMFSFCKDIAFCEELKSAGFSTATLLIFADDALFYKGPSSGIYGYFRGKTLLHGPIQKPTGRKDELLSIKGQYFIEWQPIAGPLMYAVVEAQSILVPEGSSAASELKVEFRNP